MRASVSHDIVFHDVSLPLAHAVGLQAPGPAAPDPGAQRSQEWISALLIAIYTGVLKSGRDWLAGYLNDRVPTNLGASLATLPRFQSAVGEIEALAYTNERLLYSFTADLETPGSATTILSNGTTATPSAAGSTPPRTMLCSRPPAGPSWPARGNRDRHRRPVGAARWCAAGVWCSPVNRIEDLATDEQAWANDYLVRFPDGFIGTPGPYQIGDWPGLQSIAGAYGEHTDEESTVW